MARLSRHELKQDEFVTTVEAFEHFAKENYQQILAGVAVAVIVVGGFLGWKTYTERQESAANTALAAALTTYNAPAAGVNINLFNNSNAPTSEGQFSGEQEKYKKALSQFSDVAAKYPRQPAGGFALYHAGLCQAALGNSPAALKTLDEASHNSDADVASLARMALAGEMVKAGKTADAVKIYQDLSNHPTTTVPRATALMALANLYRYSQPAQARAVYEQVEKEFGSDSYIASMVKQQMASLPK